MTAVSNLPSCKFEILPAQTCTCVLRKVSKDHQLVAIPLRHLLAGH